MTEETIHVTIGCVRQGSAKRTSVPMPEDEAKALANMVNHYFKGTNYALIKVKKNGKIVRYINNY